MKVTIELIDELRSRVNISYEDAKKVLERNDGDLIKSIIEIENSRSRKKVKSNNYRRRNNSFDNFIKSLLSFKFSITKNNMIILNVPLILVVIIAWFNFWVSLGLVLLAIVTSCRFRFYTVEYEDEISDDNSKKNINNKDKTTYYNRFKEKNNACENNNEDNENEIIIE